MKDELWAAINDYAVACGGTTAEGVYGNVPRMNAVMAVERAVAGIMASAKAPEIERGTKLWRETLERANAAEKRCAELEADKLEMCAVADRALKERDTWRGHAEVLDAKLKRGRMAEQLLAHARGCAREERERAEKAERLLDAVRDWLRGRGSSLEATPDKWAELEAIVWRREQPKPSAEGACQKCGSYPFFGAAAPATCPFCAEGGT